jgi:short subunit dehydrogenase-like uncharacterized protein
MPAAADRAHDIVVFGATGFTGALTAQYLAEHADAGTRWALAGRNRDKLEKLREQLGVDVDLLHADVEEPASLREVAEATRVLVTTVGPYIHYGEPVVAACAAAGTAYLDLTGEPEFMDRMYVLHHAAAQRTGARLIHACGFDSVPHDLGAQFTVEQLPDGVPIKVEGFVRAGGRPSGGTFHSAMMVMSRQLQTRRAHAERMKLEPTPDGRRIRGIRGVPHHEDAVPGWVLPAPLIDPQIVLQSARALPRYGPDFSYGHYIAVKRLPQAVGLAAGVGALFTAAQIPPARKLLLSRQPAGEGPSPEQREKSWFKVRFAGEGGGRRVVTEVAGGDPGYGETSKMLAESALTLVHEDVPETAGQVTTAVAMGALLRERLQRAGIHFTVAGREEATPR